ncbi:MAG: lactonase family protein [Lachnospiraceae bacterium]|nr:lactonase family protein [Lachnospiraceae bacterium]
MRMLYVTSAVQDGGVYTVQFDETSGKMTVKGFRKLGNCQYCIASEGRLYVVRRAGEDGNGSFLDVLDILPDGSLSDVTEELDTKLPGVCHLCRYQGSTYIAHYRAGALMKAPDQVLQFTGHGSNPKRQEKPHDHFVAVTPDQKYLVTTDLGTDTVYVVSPDLSIVSKAHTLRGQGPRHLVFSEDGKYCYVLTEMGSAVDVFSYEDGRLTFITAYDALPLDYDGESIAAAIRLYRGRLYTTNRGHQSIAVFDVNGKDLKPAGIYPCGGEWPRDMNITDDWVIVANEEGHTVNLLKIKADGSLRLSEEKLDIQAPMCVCIGEGT